MEEKRILHITYGSIRHAPRLIHAAQSGVDNGYAVCAMGAPRESFPAQPTEEIIDGISAYLIPLLTRVRFIDLLRAIKYLLYADLGAETTPMPNNRIKLRTGLNILLFNLWILRFIPKLKPDLIHCHELWGLPASLLVAKLKRIPIVYDVWDPHFLQYNNPKVNRIISTIERFLSCRADIVITASERLKQHFISIGVSKVEYVGNWKRLSDYDAIDSERLAALRDELGMPPDALIVSYIGLLFETRQIPVLLAAMELVPDIYLIIAGRGTFRQEVIEASERLPNIKWLDWIDLADVPMYTCLSDVIYWCAEDVPVSNIIAPNKLFETFASGNVALARKGVGEMGEILAATQAGFLLDTVTPETVADALRQLQNPDLLQTYKDHSWTARETYNWSKAEELLLRLYEDLLA